MSILTSSSRPRGSNFELWSWVFMRVSALLLIFLALTHFVIMHMLTPTEQVNYGFVAERFSTPFWRTYDLVMLFLGVLHGMNGLRIITDDYVHSRAWRAFWMVVLYTVAFVFLVIGSQVVLSFQPATSR